MVAGESDKIGLLTFRINIRLMRYESDDLGSAKISSDSSESNPRKWT